jgi:hypothetical protein
MIVAYKDRMVFKGECDGLVYYWNRKVGKMIARRYVVPKASSANRKLGAISKHLKSLELSPSYIEDMKIYVALYSQKQRDKCFLSWRNAFLTMMFKLAKTNSQVDLNTINREQIETEQLPCVSVKQAVEAGLLPLVDGYETLTNTL